MRKKEEQILLLLIILISIPLFLILPELNLKFDLTDNQVYSVKNSTKNILTQFDQPLYITWWKSEEFDSPQLDLIKDFLNRLPLSTDYMLNFEVKTPEEDEQKRLKSRGITEQQIEISDRGKVVEKLIYSTIEISYLDEKEFISFVVKPEEIEFQIAQALTSLLDHGHKTVAIFPDSIENNPSGSYTIITSELSKYFNVISVTEENALTTLPDILIIPDRKEYSVDELFVIDRSIQQGSPAIFLIDGMKINPQQNDYTSIIEEKTIIQKWMNSYGVSTYPALIRDKNSLLLNFISDGSQRFDQYNFWIKGNNQFDLLWASPLKILEKNDIKNKVLIESSEFSWISEGETDLRPDFNLEKQVFSGPYPVVVELKGFFQPLFKNSELVDRKEGTIVVIGSTLCFSDFIQNSGSYKNSIYLRNTIYTLLGKSDLYETAISTIENNEMDLDFLIQGTGKNRIIFINLILFPAVLTVCYIFLIIRRNKNRNV